MPILECLANILRDVIPDKNLPTPVWLARILVLFLIANSFILGGYFLLRDTAIGDRYGFRPLIVVPQLSERDFARIQKTIYGNMARLREDKPEAKAVFLIMGFDEQTGEFSYLDRTGTMTIMKWLVATDRFYSPETIDDLWQVNREAYQQLLIDDRKSCITNEIRPVNQGRIRDLWRDIEVDRFVMCPVVNPKKDRTFGTLVVLWQAPKTNIVAADRDMINTVRTYTKAIEQYLLLQPKLTIRG